MARTFDEIKTEIKTKIRTYPNLDNFQFPEDGGSNLSVFNLLIDVFSGGAFLAETIFDILKDEIQAIADSAPSGNQQWVRAQMLKFQFGDQIELDENFTPYYPVIDTAKQIVTRAAVQEVSSGLIQIKVAKGTAPALEPLTTPELDALKDYYFGTSSSEGIGFAGVTAAFVSQDPDRMRVQANIYYQGQFTESVVSANVITAIDNFFATFTNEAFDGTVFIINLTDAIQAVEGVTRVVYTSIKAREFDVALGSATSIDFQGIYPTQAGYLISEDTAGNTLSDTLTFIRETV